MSDDRTMTVATQSAPGWELPPEELLLHVRGMEPPADGGAGLGAAAPDLRSQEAIIVFDIPSLRLVHITPGAEYLYGRPLAELCRRPQFMLETIHPEDAEPLDLYFPRLLEHPDGERIIRFLRPDQSIIWVNSRYRVTFDEQGRPLRLTYRIRRLTEAELRAVAGDRLGFSPQLADIVPGFVFELDALGRVVYANRYAALLSGYRPGDLERGLCLDDIFLPEDRDGIHEYFATIMAGREVQPREFRIRCRDGSMALLYGTAVRIIREGKPSGIRGVLVDVTKLRQAEQQQRLLQATLNHSHDSVFIVDMEGRFVWVNDTSCSRLGYSRDELLGMEACQIETTLPPGGCKRMLAKLRETGSRIMEGIHRAKDGRTFPVEVVANLITFEGQEYACVIARDVTARQIRLQEREATIARLERQRRAYEQMVADEELAQGDWSAAVRRLCRIVAETLDVERVGLWTVEEDGTLLKCENLYVRGDGIDSGGMLIKAGDLEDYLEAIRHQHVIDAADAKRDPRTAELKDGYLEPLGVGAMLDTAVVLDGVVEGVLCCEHVGGSRVWQPDEISFAVSAASTAARIWERCARQEAERERALFRTAADKASYGVLVRRLDGTIVYVNEACARMHGYAPDELVGENVDIFFAEEYRQQQDVLDGIILREGGYAGRELWHVRRDGTRFAILANAVLVRDEQGRPDLVVSSEVDITELKRHQQELNEERRRLKNFIASLPGFVFRIRNEPDWPVEFISEGCLAITGWTAEELTENSHARHIDCVHPDDRPLVWEAMDRSLEQGRPYEVEYRVVTRQGETRWVWERGYGVYGEGGKLVAAEGFVFDITDRVVAEQRIRQLNADLERRVRERTLELERSREKYRLLVESLRDSYIFLSFEPDGSLGYASPSLEQVLGYTLEEFASLHGQLRQPRPGYEEIQKAFTEARAGRHPEAVEIDIRHKSGERRVLEVLLVPVVQDGRVQSIEAVGHDITEHKRQLEMIQKAQDQLVEAEKMAALGRMVAGMAHEINTPIGIGVTAATHLQSLCRDLEQRFRAGTLRRTEMEKFLLDSDEAARMVLTNLNKAAQLIQGFKGVAVDQSDEARRRFDLKEYLEEILLSLRPALKRTPHQVVLECPEGLELDSRPGALSHIVTNLIMNSLIHGFAGREEPGRIEIVVTSTDGEVTLRYRDDGVGMDEATRQRIYEPFFTTRRGEGGSGLGMHVVYRAVTESLQGRIACESSPGAGVTFTITFPRRIEDHDG